MPELFREGKAVDETDEAPRADQGDDGAGGLCSRLIVVRPGGGGAQGPVVAAAPRVVVHERVHDEFQHDRCDDDEEV
eukprot:CAMPEP_0182474482 /NCGR_PEP_ID=MMETSP1319-20130603/25724_1 /TAXON_ID=172717 /ORGANISM="Bolidomonas pacifica, Strain RCC208" /LENGTH=76 /DNA_ID=CAMNT_0024675375 /DNA_START=204 /DNA_END=434 /DNA_ORIENTATION=-